MTNLFGTQYFGFILSAYGITVVVLVALTISILITHRRRKNQLAELEKVGLKRASGKNG